MLSLALIGAGSVLAWSAWIYILLRVDPFTDRAVLLGIQYLSLGLALQGTVMLGAFAWRRRRMSTFASHTGVQTIARQAALATLFILTALYLSSRDLLRWWNVLPLALFTFSIELFFASMKGGQARASRSTNQYVSK